MKGISYEQVAAAADALTADEQKPSMRAVRDRIGSGSLSTIHKHLAKWQDSIQKPAAMVLTLSQNLTNAIIAEISRNTAEARAGLEIKLHEALSASTDLANAGERLENEREDLATQVVELTRERDHVAGKSAQQEVDLALTTERADREQAAVRSAQVELAMEKLKLVDLQKRDFEQTKEIEQKSTILETERKARIVSEQQVAVLNAKYENALEQAEKSNLRIESLSQQVNNSAKELAALRDQIHGLHADNSAQTRQNQDALLRAERATAEAIQQVQRLSIGTHEAANALKHAEREASELRGRLDALQDRAKELQTAG